MTECSHLALWGAITVIFGGVLFVGVLAFYLLDQIGQVRGQQ